MLPDSIVVKSNTLAINTQLETFACCLGDKPKDAAPTWRIFTKHVYLFRHEPPINVDALMSFVTQMNAHLPFLLILNQTGQQRERRCRIKHSIHRLALFCLKIAQKKKKRGTVLSG